MSALAILIVSKYTPRPRFFDLETILLIRTIKYSRILVFCSAWLKTNSKAIVITAGFENPASASSIVKKPPKNRTLSRDRATTSMLNLSEINKINATRTRHMTNIISGVM